MTCRVRTLRQAQELLNREWPGNAAPASAWLAYHQRAAELYAHIAKVDTGHQHEAQYWVTQEEEQVRILTETVEHQAAEGGTHGR